nr:natural killer cell receptor 2B4 isoform X2 [Mirounga angustirostris]
MELGEGGDQREVHFQVLLGSGLLTHASFLLAQGKAHPTACNAQGWHPSCRLQPGFSFLESLDSAERVVGLSGNQLSLLPHTTQTKQINSAQWKMQRHSSSGFSVILIWKNESEIWTADHLKQTFNFIKRNLTLLIKTAQQNDSGLYLLEVTDDCGRVENHQFQVSVFDHVGTLEVVEERKVLDRGKCQVSLSCSVSRGGNVSYVWYRGSKLIQKPSNLSKLEEQIDVNDLDIYTCNVSNPVSWVNHTFTQSCQSADRQFTSVNFLMIIVIFLITLSLGALTCFCVWRRKRKQSETSRGETLTVYEDVNTRQNRRAEAESSRRRKHHLLHDPVPVFCSYITRNKYIICIGTAFMEV